MSSKSRIIFTTNRQSDRGIMSVILGCISFASLVFGVVYSYANSGAVIRERFGAGLLLTLVFSIIGLTLGMLARSEVDRYKAMPLLGITLNLLIIIVLAMFLWIGLN